MCVRSAAGLEEVLMCVCVVCSWVFVHEKAYQVRDTAVESSVMTKVKGFGIYNNRVMDVADYVTPPPVTPPPPLTLE